MKTLLIINSKGGTGKTTLVANLGIEFAKEGRVSLLDLDPQRSLEQWWRMRDKKNPDLKVGNISKVVEFIQIAKREQNDFMLIDTAGEFSNKIKVVLPYIDLAIIPCKPTPTDFRAVGYSLNLLKANKVKFFFLFTQGIANSLLTVQAFAKLSQFGIIAPTQMMQRAAYAKAMFSGDGAANFDKIAKREINEIYFFINKLLEQQ